ncbi:hypothetical protein scyTo_0008906 [Scyliorhinus torazame]|uniref:Uncharacterized protein n=1 Tax=Scyliorhinus torazame TaxID=75743 RepID=A0A401PF25_SCYTO|nr:hypothetical protein [Scyliorhinus torazame]
MLSEMLSKPTKYEPCVQQQLIQIVREHQLLLNASFWPPFAVIKTIEIFPDYHFLYVTTDKLILFCSCWCRGPVHLQSTLPEQWISHAALALSAPRSFLIALSRFHKRNTQLFSCRKEKQEITPIMVNILSSFVWILTFETCSGLKAKYDDWIASDNETIS